MAYKGNPLAFGNVGGDDIAGVHYQAVKLMDATPGSTVTVPARSSAPASTDVGLVVRAIPTTAQAQAAAQGAAGSSENPWWVRETNPSTAGGGAGSTTVDAHLSSAGSTRSVGRVTVENPTTAVSVANPTTAVSVANPTTAVTITNPTTGVSVSSGLVLGGSTALVGMVDGVSFSSANAARTTANTSAEVSLLAANASRKAALIQNLSTGAELWLGLSTGAISTALANVQIKVPANGFITFGGQVGNFPNFTGPIRGRIGSTTLAGPVAIVEFT